MLYALTKDGERVYPKSTGERALCPSCNGILASRVGVYAVPHWYHLNSDCIDNWVYEPMSPWHKSWQNNWPISNQEVIIKKRGSSHRADILTDSGIVIEFQHSRISPQSIYEREEFYEKMIWVFNGSNFFKSQKGDLYKKRFTHIAKEVAVFNHFTYFFKIKIEYDFFADNEILFGLKRYLIAAQEESFFPGREWKYEIQYKDQGKLQLLIKVNCSYVISGIETLLRCLIKTISFSIKKFIFDTYSLKIHIRYELVEEGFFPVFEEEIEHFHLETEFFDIATRSDISKCLCDLYVDFGDVFFKRVKGETFYEKVDKDDFLNKHT